MGGTEYPEGSSPLTRGKPSRSKRKVMVRGLIPAHAGKTRRGRQPCETIRAHPRSRGENEVPGTTGLTLGGSSPLTRGKLERSQDVKRRSGLIPAHAGKTGTKSTVSLRMTAHPRSRGENPRPRAREPCRSGSSPLTRGKLSEEMGPPPDRGLIPAHAGKTTV